MAERPDPDDGRFQPRDFAQNLGAGSHYIRKTLEGDRRVIKMALEDLDFDVDGPMLLKQIERVEEAGWQYADALNEIAKICRQAGREPPDWKAAGIRPADIMAYYRLLARVRGEGRMSFDFLVQVANPDADIADMKDKVKKMREALRK